MKAPRLVLVLSENWTMTPPGDLRALVRIARAAEDAGFDAVMVSEHVVMGRGADAGGAPANPRDYALPGNQDPATPWPESDRRAERGRGGHEPFAARGRRPHRPPPSSSRRGEAARDPRPPLGGRLVIQPTVSWHRAEYEALGVPFEARGELLDEHLAVWRRVWQTSPASHEGGNYPFGEIWVEPKPFREGGPPLWFGGSGVHPRLLRRLVRYGSGFNPLGRASDADLERLRAALGDAGRDISDLELVGGTRGAFRSVDDVADLSAALASVPDQVARGFTTICIKPSQFLDDAARIGPWCEEVIERVGALGADR